MDYFADYKIELLTKHNNSRALYKVLEEATEQFYWETNDNDLVVENDPYGAGYTIEAVVSLLNDLAAYNRHARYDEKIPNDLKYITKFWQEAE